MDPQVAKEPVLTKAVQQRKLELEKEAQTKGLAETHKGWTHDTLAARLFDHTDDEYTDRLQNMLEGKVAFLQATKKPK
jgi:transposase